MRLQGGPVQADGRAEGPGVRVQGKPFSQCSSQGVASTHPSALSRFTNADGSAIPCPEIGLSHSCLPPSHWQAFTFWLDPPAV